MAETVVKAKSKTRYGTIVHKCTCKGTKATEYQDKVYGHGMRVFNLCKLGENARCTCCAKEIDAKSGSIVKQSTKKEGIK